MVRIMMVGSYERKRVGFGGRHSPWRSKEKGQERDFAARTGERVRVLHFRSSYARIGRLGTISQCGRMCNFVTRRRRCSGSRKKFRSHLGRLELPNGTPCVAYRKAKVRRKPAKGNDLGDDRK